MFNRDIVRGSLGFAAVGVAAFAVWAFAGRSFGSEALMYAAVAGVFLAGTGMVLHPLAGSVRRFYLTFVPAFLAYAVVWSVLYLAWKTKLSEWLASAAGCAAFAAVLSLRSPSRMPAVAVVLFLTHSVGYFLGGDIYYAIRPSQPTLAKLAWGLCYGLGFGAGLGYAYKVQRPTS